MTIKTRHYLSAIGVATLFSTLAPLSLSGEQVKPSVSRVVIIDYGIFRPSTSGKIGAPETESGYFHVVPSVKLVQRTNQIPARLGISFGMLCRISGTPKGAVIHATVTAIHPTTASRKSGKGTEVERWPLVAKLGELAYAGWQFEKSSEVISGNWTIQLVYAGKVIAEKEFNVHLR